MKKTFYEACSDCGKAWNELLDEILKALHIQQLIKWLDRKIRREHPEGE